MTAPLTLVQSRNNDRREFLRLAKIFSEGGISALTLGEHKRYLGLRCLDAYKELEQEIGENEIKRRAERRIREGKKYHGAGRAPIPQFGPWKWDTGEKVYTWSSFEKPKNFLGSIENINHLPGYIEKPNPFEEGVEGRLPAQKL